MLEAMAMLYLHIRVTAPANSKRELCSQKRSSSCCAFDLESHCIKTTVVVWVWRRMCAPSGYQYIYALQLNPPRRGRSLHPNTPNISAVAYLLT